jgi:hypothetical protein
VYREVEIARPVREGETVGGLCPTCMVPVDNRLFGSRAPVVGYIVKKFCGCGKQLITVRQHVEGRCECCAGQTAALDVEAWR